MGAIPNTATTAALLQTPTQTPQRISRLARSAQLWHLLSLDAPTVAMLWTWFLARTNHIVLPAAVILAMGIAVWMLYAADRLLDTRDVNIRDLHHRSVSKTPATDCSELEPRHHFHRHHQRAFRFGILIASIVLAMLLPQLAPSSIHLYLLLGTLLLAYFILVHLSATLTSRVPKELAVGLFFAAATLIPTIARGPELRLALLPGALLFAAVCSLNCLCIYSWEHATSPQQGDAATRAALRFLPLLVFATALAALLLSIADHALPWPISMACGIAAVFLLLLHKNKRHFSPTTLRAAADICLLTPLPLLLRLHR